MTQQEEHNSRLQQHIQKSIAAKFDNLFAYPNAEYAEDIKQNIYEKTTQFLEERCSDCTIIDSQISPTYNSDNQTLAIDIQFQMNKPIDAVDIEITKPETMTEEQFDNFVDSLQEELQNIDYGTSDTLLQND